MEGTRPPGRPPKHHARWLARSLKENGLDGRTGPAKLLRMRENDLADDAGGWPNLTNREGVLVKRTAALTQLCETIEHYVFSQESPFTNGGELLAVLGKNYIAYANALRRNLEALGLRPDNAEKVPSLAEYLAARASTAQPAAAGSGQATASTEAQTPSGTPKNGDDADAS